MEIFRSLHDIRCATGELDLTIGSFDGLHLGHQALIQALRPNHVVLTFSNHPQSILTGHAPPLLTSSAHRPLLFSRYGVHTLCEIPFTKELSQLTTAAFLSLLRKTLPFTRLVLGHDALLGHHREGTPEVLRSLTDVIYIPPVTLNNQILSSRLIRSALAQGDLAQVSAYLGRPYSIVGSPISGAGIGTALGFPTVNIDVTSLALPPFGVYTATVLSSPALVNLGCAPTLHSNRPPRLEIHFLTPPPPLDTFEVILHHFLRPEKTFSSPEALKHQIAQDVAAYKLMLCGRVSGCVT